MKQEILFRGKLNLSEKWVFGMPSYDLQYIFNDCNLDSPDNFEVNPKTIGQFTGLFDKKKTKIFSGDILKIESEKLMVVGWSKKFASFILNREGWAFSHWFGESCNSEDCEVVGNIFDTPELLEAAN